MCILWMLIITTSSAPSPASSTLTPYSLPPSNFLPSWKMNQQINGWVHFVLHIYARVCDHPLEHGWPTDLLEAIPLVENWLGLYNSNFKVHIKISNKNWIEKKSQTRSKTEKWRKLKQNRKVILPTVTTFEIIFWSPFSVLSGWLCIIWQSAIVRESKISKTNSLSPK